MDNQTPTVRMINPAFTGPQNEPDQSEKTRMGQPAPPPYHPNAGYQVPSTNPNPFGYPNQPYRAPGGPQGPYIQQLLQGMSAYPQSAQVGQTGITMIQPAVVVTPMPMFAAVPDYMFYSIFTMLCCCLPLGIAAVIYSCYTRDANLAGQQELATSNSRVAFILNNVALGVGLTITTVLSIIIILTVLTAR